MYNNYNAGGDNAGGGFYGDNNNAGGFQQNNQYQNTTQQPPQQQQQQQQQNQFQNPNQWAVPQQNQQQQQPMNQSYDQQNQYPPQQQQQQPQGGAFFGAPTQGGGGSSSSGFGMMKDMATSAALRGMTGQGLNQDDIIKVVDIGIARLIPGVDYTMQTLRTYYAVDNNYVKRKMQKVLFPFLSKHWKRQIISGGDSAYQQPGQPLQPTIYALPYSDENAPDLYIPVMSLITYSLLAALCYGTAGKFNPEVIADVTTKCFLTQILEVAIIRFGFYTMQVPVAFLDLISYTGYKYLGLTINMLFGLFLGFVLDYGMSGFYVTFLWTASAAFYFMLKTMTYSIPEQTAQDGPKRSFMVLGFAASQVATMWFVSQTKFL
mmetsp:Transcript_21212/g.52194  ORF Transcript_21212/g.52194 Transcript_21212/m.52194 type:complete len:375 (+) Transcript_21212:118-1242(+)